MNRISLRTLFLAASLALIMSWNGVRAATTTDAAAGSQPNAPGVSFPVKELGNCKSQAECKTYCDDPGHITSCVAFAKAHGIISNEDAQHAQEFAGVIAGGGPGGCKTRETCAAYCSQTAHIDECLTFAEKHNFLSAGDIQDARRISSALKAGAKLPGGCTDKESCQAYCGLPSHAEECFAFAQRAGLMTADEVQQAQRVLPYLEKGETPGGCKTQDECQQYCSQEPHFTECINFAQKIGMISAEEASQARKTGGKGPGGCHSREQCETYCNAKEHQQECFTFAKDHDLIPPEKLKEMEQGMSRLRAGVAQMPGEVVSCLKEHLGDNIVGQIQSGAFAPGPETGDTVKSCFDEFAPQLKQKMEEGLKNAPPAVLQCLKNDVGESVIAQMQSGNVPDPDTGDKIRHCFEQAASQMMNDAAGQIQKILQNAPPEVQQCFRNALGADTLAKIQSSTSVSLSPDVIAKLKTCTAGLERRGQAQPLPPVVAACITRLYGSDVLEKMQSGSSTPPADIGDKIRQCVQEMAPVATTTPPGGGTMGPMPPVGGGTQGAAPTMESCLEQIYGPDIKDRMQNGQFTPPPDMQQRTAACMQQTVQPRQ